MAWFRNRYKPDQVVTEKQKPPRTERWHWWDGKSAVSACSTQNYPHAEPAHLEEYEGQGNPPDACQECKKGKP